MKSKAIKTHISQLEGTTMNYAFVFRLLKWYESKHRSLPWRQTNDPYCIWVSEILLQQTRVSQALPYYHRFIDRFPTVSDLAVATEDSILKVWEGLGYYSRARNLHACAKFILSRNNSKFPDTLQGLLSLPGVGPYTAAALGSICFGIAEPAIDGNIFRVYSRFFGISEDITKLKTRRIFEELLRPAVPKNKPGDFNQAGMELGATICLPKNPKCMDCPIENMCFARSKKLQDELPVKHKKGQLKERFLFYKLHFHDGKLLVRQRQEQDIWKGLYEFTPQISTENLWKESEEFYPNPSVLKTTHLLSHQKIMIKFEKIEVESEEEFKEIANIYDMKSYNHQEWLNLPFPVPFKKALGQFINDEKKWQV